jgi:hypothetical protein
MRMILALFACLGVAGWCSLRGEKPAEAEKRYDQTLDLKKYPQDTPKSALASFIKAIENKEVAYALAHLAEPAFVDQRVKDLEGKFDALVMEAKGKLADDPAALKLLQRLAKDGAWKEEDGRASVSLKDVSDKQVFFVKRKDRWFIENRFKPTKEPHAGKSD